LEKRENLGRRVSEKAYLLIRPKISYSYPMSWISTYPLSYQKWIQRMDMLNLRRRRKTSKWISGSRRKDD